MTTVSLVVSTLNRADVLGRCLDSLRWLENGSAFEVVVVAGPSTDTTDEILAEWADRITIVRCDEANLSTSRNLGIGASAGDVVAFIDDDAVPEPEWLSELLPAFDDPETGAAGGFVFNHDGLEYQYRFGLFDRLGWPQPAHDRPAPGFVFPSSWVFPHLIGTNVAFRRDALVEIGGFDEEYEYFLDDTDVVVRLLDRGWGIRQVSGAHVHHKFAPSAIRAENRVAADRRSILKNHTYFGLRHASAFLDRVALDAEHDAFVVQQRDEIAQAVDAGTLSPDDLTRYDEGAVDAVARGRAAAGRPAVLGLSRAPSTPFSPFESLVGERAEHVVLEDETGSEGAFADARRRAEAGQVPHLIRPTADFAFVDFQGGVWVHGIVVGDDWPAAAQAERDRVQARFPA